MSIFEEVFSKRGDAEDVQTTQPHEAVFEDVFVRRGRWRNKASKEDSTEQTQPDAMDLPAPLDEPKANCKSLDGPVKPDVSHLIVKNGFYSEAIEYDSLKDFLFERKIQSCPVASLDLETIAGEDTNSELDSLDESISTDSDNGEKDEPLASAQPQHMFNTGSNLDDLDAPRMDTESLEEALKTGSNYGDVMAPLMPSGYAFSGVPSFDNNAPFQSAYDQPEDALTSLRMKGSVIHREILRVKVSELNIAMGETVSPGSVADCVDQPSVPWYTPRPDSLQTASFPPPPPLAMAPVSAPVLRLAEAVAPPQLGTPALPSIGSLLHHKRECKPCTFFHTRGCENEEDCQFCHLCGPGEKKKRLRQQRAQKREVQAAALDNARAILAAYNAAEECAESDMIIE